jgi:RimJ/RimL family protein N-acetyltransferase
VRHASVTGSQAFIAAGRAVVTARCETIEPVSDRARDPDELDRLGLRVTAMSPALAPALDRFHEGLSLATTRNRFFSPHPHLSAAEIERFTNVDHRDRDALVVLDPNGDIVAVARFDRLGELSATAEVAFVIADRWQHHGVGSALFARLAARAREVGVTRFVAETLAGNSAMRAVFRHAGTACRESVEQGVVHVTIDLAPT